MVNMLYQVLLGQEKGPALRFFRRRYGIAQHHRHDRRRAGAIGVNFLARNGKKAAY